MKNIGYILLSLFSVCLLSVSCQVIFVPEEGRGVDEPVSVAVDSGLVCLQVIPDDGPVDTKVVINNPSVQESPVSRWAYIVFENTSPYRFVRRGVCTSSSVSFSLPANRSYRIRVIANYPTSGSNSFDVNSVANLSDYNALTSYLGDNAVGSFVMAGSTSSNSFTVNPTSGDQVNSITVRLKRLVSKVTLVNIRRQFTDATKGSKSLVLRHIYVTNVYPYSRYSSDYSVSETSSDCSLWYNYRGWHRSGSAAAVSSVDALVGDRNLNVSLTQNQTSAIGRSLFFYPNPLLMANDVKDDHDWTGRRCTRIVLDCVYDGDESKGCYYTATLHMDNASVPLARNYSYQITCTLTDVGSSDPEYDIDQNIDVTFTYSLEWDGAYNVHENS